MAKGKIDWIAIDRIAVIGAGLMGHGIAQEFAAAGYPIRLFDQSDAILAQALQNIEDNLGRLAAQGLIGTEAIPRTLASIHACASVEEAVRDADLVIESVTENLPIKLELFRMLDDLSPLHAILASNTSTFMPGRLAEATRRPAQVIIAHFFNPPYLLPLVEVVPGPQTAEKTVRTMLDLLTGIGKTPVLLRREAPGFVGNRLQMALLREALHIVQEGIASPQEVDAVVRNGFGRRLAAAGPFEISEIGGWDLWRAIAEQLLPSLDANQEIPALLQERVDRGELGFKSGQGFYTWSPEAADTLRSRIARTLLAISMWNVSEGEH